MRRIKAAGIVLGTAAAVWALGCGGDDTTPPPVVTTVDVRDGTWIIIETSSFRGADSCVARGSETLDTADVVCSRDLISTGDEFPVSCDLVQDGDQLTFDCEIRVDLGICLETIRFLGGGTVTETSFDLDFDVVQRVTPKDPQNADACELFYGRFVDACTLSVHSVGAWVDSGPTCTIAGTDTVPTRLETLYWAEVNSPAKLDYSWKIAGNGTIDSIYAGGDTIRVKAATAQGSFTLTLDIGPASCPPYICEKVVTVVSAPAAPGPRPASAPAPAPAEPAAGERTPVAQILSGILRRSLPRDP